MRTLIVYYSYTGNNKRVAFELSKLIKADIVEIRDWLLRLPLFFLYFIGGMMSSFGMSTQIKYKNTDKTSYNRIILLCPVWGWKLVPAMRSFIGKNNDYRSKCSLCCVCRGGKKYSKQISDDFMKLAGERPKDLLMLSEGELKKNQYEDQLEEFIKG